jgi:hypothetical protein
VKTFRIEPIRIFPQRAVAVPHPGQNYDFCPFRDRAAADPVRLTGHAARQNGCRRIKPYRFVNHHAGVRELFEVAVSRRTTAEHCIELRVELGFSSG